MTTLRIGILGAGHLGKFHIQQAKEIEGLELVGFYDPDKEKVQQTEKDLGVRGFSSMEELIDQVFSTVNDRMKAIKTLAISKSAIRHNMAEDITSFHLPVCLIWGRQDAVTPPEVADKFHELLPNSDLFWIDHCGHAAMMEHPQEFNTIVDEWLKKNEVA